jgi:hypothetical protein
MIRSASTLSHLQMMVSGQIDRCLLRWRLMVWIDQEGDQIQNDKREHTCSAPRGSRCLRRRTNPPLGSRTRNVRARCPIRVPIRRAACSCELVVEPAKRKNRPPSSKLGFQCQSMRVSCETGMERDGRATGWNADPRFRCYLWIERRSAFYRHRVPDRAQPFPNGLDGRSRVSVTSVGTPSWNQVLWVLMDNEHPTA